MYNSPCKQTGSYLDLNLSRFYKDSTKLAHQKSHSCTELRIPVPLIFNNGPAILFILSGPFVVQLTRRISQESQEVFDWFISILNLSQVLIFDFLIGSFLSYISIKWCQPLFSFILPVPRFWQRPENSVCTSVFEWCLL